MQRNGLDGSRAALVSRPLEERERVLQDVVASMARSFRAETKARLRDFVREQNAVHVRAGNSAVKAESATKTGAATAYHTPTANVLGLYSNEGIAVLHGR